MKELVSGCIQSHARIFIALLVCVGCQAPHPMPLPQPIWQPISPITQPFPQPTQPISQPIQPIQPISPPIQPITQPISPPIQPISQPTTPGSPPITLSGTVAQQATVKAALARCTFPFERLRPGLQRAGLSSVNISWQPMNEGSLGWASTGGQVAIKNGINGLQAQRTTIMELGHIVDFFYMTPEMRKAVIRLWHPDIPDNHEWFESTDYWNQNGEAFSALFLWAFTDEEMWFDAGYSHKPSKELAIQLRAIMLPETAMKRR